MPIKLDFGIESQDMKVFSISPIRTDAMKQMTLKQFLESQGIQPKIHL